MKNGMKFCSLYAVIRLVLITSGFFWVATCLPLVTLCVATAQVPTAQEPAKTRFALRTLDSHFPFAVPADVKTWNERAEALRFHLQMSLWLWPMPEKQPLKPIEHCAIDMGEFTVSRVYFESFPGFYVTGSLYRPKNLSQPGPGVLCPHGHHRNGRFMRSNDQEIKRMIAAGEERYEPNARSPLQSHCVHLARMGCTVFHYDMIGYADSQQIPDAVAHGFARQREKENEPDAFGFFSPRAELHLQSIMGLQTWNSIRALDFLSALPEVDPQRIGVTGCSGGGTQTFILTALDSRVTAAFPAAMVSTAMQGGCTCENCCNLRVVTGNVEIAALAAPRPLAMSACNDWTKDMATDGYPQLQELYKLVGTPERVFLSASTTFPHGYDQVARRVMYGWFDKFLGINSNRAGLTFEQIHAGTIPEDSPLFEKPITFLDPTQLTVWGEGHPVPPTGVDIEHRVNRHWRDDQAKKIRGLIQTSDPQLRAAVKSLLCELPHGSAADELRNKEKKPFVLPAGYTACQAWSAVVGNETDTVGIEVARILKPGNERAVPLGAVIVTADVDAALARPVVQSLVNRGGVTFIVNAKQLQQENRLVDNGREAAGYTFGYNRSHVARGARALAWILDEELFSETSPIDLIVLDGSPASLIVAAAATKRRIQHVLIPADFSCAAFDSFRHADFFPGALKLGDTEGILKIAKPVSVRHIGTAEEEQTRFLTDLLRGQ